jgi:hypothetical protein
MARRSAALAADLSVIQTKGARTDGLLAGSDAGRGEDVPQQKARHAHADQRCRSRASATNLARAWDEADDGSNPTSVRAKMRHIPVGHVVAQQVDASVCERQQERVGTPASDSPGPHFHRKTQADRRGFPSDGSL